MYHGKFPEFHFARQQRLGRGTKWQEKKHDTHDPEYLPDARIRIKPGNDTAAAKEHAAQTPRNKKVYRKYGVNQCPIQNRLLNQELADTEIAQHGIVTVLNEVSQLS